MLRSHTSQDSDSPLPTVVSHGGCLFNEAHFAKGNGLVVVECRGPDVPKVMLYNLTEEEKEEGVSFVISIPPNRIG